MISSIDLPSIVTVCLMSTLANCQSSSGKIFGIGVGTFIIIIAIAFSVVWCLACRSSSNPEVYSILGVLIPILLFIIFIFMPKQVDRPTTSPITDSNFIPHIIFMVISIVGLILASVFFMLNQVFVFRKSKNIARAAFVIKQQEEEKLFTRQNQKVAGGERMKEQQSKSNHQISLQSPKRNSETEIQNRPLKRN